MPRLLRRLLPPVLSAVLATAIAVPATWYLVNRYAVDAAAELAPVPSGPADHDELRAQLLAQLPEADGAVLLETARGRGAATGLPPGRYRMNLICGAMQVQGDAVGRILIHLLTPERQLRIELPCPSTMLSVDGELEFTGLPAGAVSVNLDPDAAPAGFVLLLQLVPVAGQGGGDGD